MEGIMKKFVTAFAALSGLAAGAQAQDEVKLGVLLGFTGPIESLTPQMAWGAEYAAREATESGAFMGGSSVSVVRGDSTCIDSAVATAAAERLVTSDKVSGIVGADCSGVTGAVLQNVARPNGIVMISPSATSPALSTAEDEGLFFRTAPSDARQGQVMSSILMDRGVETVALTYTNNDYGKGLADSFAAAYAKDGGTVTVSLSHEDGKGDYSAEVGALASAGGDALVVAGYIDQGGLGVIQASLDAGAFETFVLPDGMIGPSIIENIGGDLEGSFGQMPGSDSMAGMVLVDAAAADGIDGTTIYVAESYDAAALIILAMQAAGSHMSEDYKSKVFDVANAPGEPILPGELGKALEILAAGGEVDYVGASDVELIGSGEAAGKFQEVEVANGEFVTIGYR